ncbi:homocysteine-responsive endoplasmic reticulum-resident ubiquitin-like domain member 2 protein [Watersipora subatra]|uniref:homocysteine-responsive endoplasmic reticulum-resident ubiquitin-like domain member 2 protein n=1 Tax=Watersipora subatra TaxID=2589382 RepID=UPI00355C48B7
MDGLGSVTLIVKAPNQRIEDQRVACDRTWTVAQLKEHLSTVHPEKPHKDYQKLVYFGKLLNDESCLQEVLTQESYDDAHTVHLVCPSQSSVEKTIPYVPRYTAQATQGTELRQRNIAQQAPSFAQPQLAHPMASNWSQSYPLSMPVPGAMTPQQQLWLRMYQQQWQQYQALMQQASAQQLSTPGEPATVPQQDGAPGAHVPPQQQGVQANPAQRRADADDGVQMNAQGGVDAAAPQHDWLDTIYIFFRFAMLLIILYFYTTLGRFSLVLFIAAFFYLAQRNMVGNLFRLERRRPAPRPAPEGQQQPPQQNENQAENLAENQNNENNERYQNEAGTPEPNNNNPQPERNGSTLLNGFKVILTFLVTFFTSLIPQNPVAVRN